MPGLRPGFEPIRQRLASPLDLIETETEVVAFVTLPGVELSGLEVSVKAGTLVLRGRRSPPPELRTAAILRLICLAGRSSAA